MNPVQSGGHRQGRPTYIHELDDWPDFRWDEEAVKQPLERVSRWQHEIVSNASNLERAAAAETTVRNLTDSAVASSRIEGEHPDPNVVEASIRRRIAAGSPGVEQGERNEPGIAAVTADTAVTTAHP